MTPGRRSARWSLEIKLAEHEHINLWVVSSNRYGDKPVPSSIILSNPNKLLHNLMDTTSGFDLDESTAYPL